MFNNSFAPAGRLEAMLLEAKGLWAEAEKAYSSLLEDNQFDQVGLYRNYIYVLFLLIQNGRATLHIQT